MSVKVWALYLHVMGTGTPAITLHNTEREALTDLFAALGIPFVRLADVPDDALFDLRSRVRLWSYKVDAEWHLEDVEVPSVIAQ